MLTLHRMTALRNAGPRAWILLLFGAVGLVVAASAAAQDWSGFRGANGGGRVAGWPEAMSDPARWPESLEREWRIPVGLGHASPVVQGERVFVFSREGDEEVLRALQAASGEEIWRSSYAAPYTMNRSALNHGPGPKGTPNWPREGSSRSGSPGSSRRGTQPTVRFSGAGRRTRAGPGANGHSTAPAVPRDHSPVGSSSSSTSEDRTTGRSPALEASTGETKWELRGDGPAYVSPTLAEVAGAPAILTMTEERIVILGPEDGRVLWEMPFTTPYDQNIVDPVVLPGGEVVIFAGLGNPTFAVRFRARRTAGSRGRRSGRRTKAPST